MATVHLLCAPHQLFQPATDDDAVLVRERFKVGETYRLELAEMRNGRFFRKWWVLAKIAFDMWAPTMPAHKFHDLDVLPDFERFRKDLTIMAGFFRPVWNAKGEMRVEAESLKWSKMTEQRFEKLYSATIDAILQKILPNRGLTEQQLRDWAERVVEFV